MSPAHTSHTGLFFIRGQITPRAGKVTYLTVKRTVMAFGDTWIREQRTAVLVVPAVVARREGNVLINPGHPDFTHITASAPEAVVWDARLFAGR